MRILDPARTREPSHQSGTAVSEESELLDPLSGAARAPQTYRGPVEIVAHRGLAHDAYELTMGAYKLAVERGARSVECDVHLTADGKLAVVHDDNLRRTTGVDARVGDLSLAEITRLAATQDPVWAGRQPQRAADHVNGTDDQVPSLEALLAFVGERGLHLELEIKDQGIDAVHAVVEQLRRMHDQISPDQITLFAWDDAQLREAAVAELAQFGSRQMRRTWLLWSDGNADHWTPDRIHQTLHAAADQDLAIGLDDSEGVRAGLFREAHARGVGVSVYTVNDRARMRDLIDMGVTGLITDRADVALDVLREADRELLDPSAR